MKFFRSIYIKVSLILILSIFATIFVESVATVIINRYIAVRNLKDFSKNLTTKLTYYLKEPLWALDDRAILTAVLQEMTDKNVYSIIVKDDYNKLLVGYKRDSNWNPIEINNEKIDLNKSDIFFYETKKIVKNDQIVGYIEIYITNTFLKPSIKGLISGILGKAILVSLTIILLIFFSLKKIILDRIILMRNVVEQFSLNNYSERCEIKIEDEIGELGTTFNIMADAIQNYNLEILTQLYFDKLTDLPNRKKLIFDIEKEFNPLLILVNIDSFQEINDFYGIDIGDKILIEMAGRLKSLLLKKDVRLYKMAGDEFAILLSYEADLEENFDMDIKRIIIDSLFEEINDKVFYIEDYEINVRITIGVAYYNENSDKTKIIKNIGKSILIYADMALKKAKKLQKHYIVYTDNMQISKEYENNIKWTLELKKAVIENRIIPYFQPIYNNRSGKIEKFECLVRLIDKNGEIVSPFHFLDVAKKSRIYPFITKIMITKSFEMFSKLDYEFSINLSVYDILNEDISNFIKFKLLEYKDLTKNVVFEILESEGIDNYDRIKDFINFAKFLGCKIAIDDFGSGYSNFTHILRLNVDYIKIDASMIKNIDKDVNSQIITKTIVNFAKELGIKTISEFVHNKEVFNKVNEIGVDFSQGYYFGEPVNNPAVFRIN